MKKTNEDLHKLIIEILEKGIIATGFGIIGIGKNNIYYEFSGFSKSGVAKVYYNDLEKEIRCLTRYDTIDVIETFDDFVGVAYRWWDNYKDRSPFEQPDSNFIPHFIRLGLIKEKVEIKYISC